MFRVYLDNILLLNEPKGLEEFEEILEYDDTVKGVYLKYPSKLLFWGDGYNYLETEFVANGYCPTYPLRIEAKTYNSDSYAIIFEGKVFLSDSEKNINKLTISCFIADDNYGAKIKNNQSQKYNLGSTTSKNGETVTACASVALTIKNTSNISLGSTREVFKLKETFEYLVSCMSDNTMLFASTWLDDLPVDEQIGILKGYELRNTDATQRPELSFKELFGQLQKIYNLGFSIERSLGVITLRIELASYYKNTTSTISVSNIDDLLQSFDNEFLYSAIKFGNNTPVEFDGGLHSLPLIPFVGFIVESFNIGGECNIDKVLDLTLDYIVDSNAIQAVVETDPLVATYDENIFLIQYNSSTLFSTMWNDILLPAPPYFYNEQFKNNKISERYNLQGQISKTIGNENNECVIENLVNDTTYLFTNTAAGTYNYEYIMSFDTEIIDTNNRFTSGNRYTSSANGVYSFLITAKLFSLYNGLWIDGVGSVSTFSSNILIRRYSAANALLSTYTSPTITSLMDELFVFNATLSPITSGIISNEHSDSFNIYLNSGEYIKASYYITIVKTNVGNSNVNWYRQIQSGFECTASSTGGGIYKESDAGAYFVSKFNFNKYLSATDWETVKASPANCLTIDHDGQSTRKAWTRKIVRNIITGATDFELISNLDNGY